jgi:hypothetical protein
MGVSNIPASLILLLDLHVRRHQHTSIGLVSADAQVGVRGCALSLCSRFLPRPRSG